MFLSLMNCGLYFYLPSLITYYATAKNIFTMSILFYMDYISIYYKKGMILCCGAGERGSHFLGKGHVEL